MTSFDVLRTLGLALQLKASVRPLRHELDGLVSAHCVSCLAGATRTGDGWSAPMPSMASLINLRPSRWLAWLAGNLRNQERLERLRRWWPWGKISEVGT